MVNVIKNHKTFHSYPLWDSGRKGCGVTNYKIQDKALHSFANTKVEEMMILNIFTFLSLIGVVHLR